MTGSGNGMDGEGVRLRVAFVLLPNFTLLPFAGFMDVLRLAADEGDRSRQIACRWVVTSVDRRRYGPVAVPSLAPTAALLIRNRWITWWLSAGCWAGRRWTSVC